VSNYDLLCKRAKKDSLLDNQSLLEKLRTRKVQAILALKACRNAIMVGHQLTPPKMKELVECLRPLKNPWICAHGRPTMRYLANLQEMRTKHLDLE